MSDTKIGWVDLTHNPLHLVRENGENGGHWCRKISEGCTNCYAETLNSNGYYKFASKLPYSGRVPGSLTLDLAVLQKMLKIKSYRSTFVGSMTDIFGEWVSDEQIDTILAYCAIAPCATRLLTKRAERMAEYFENPDVKGRIALQMRKVYDEVRLSPKIQVYDTDNLEFPLPGVTLGITVENQERANQRFCPAKRIVEAWGDRLMVSFEPLLSPVNVTPYVQNNLVGWAIIGGESGGSARTCSVEWIGDLIKQLQDDYACPIFVKQLGSRPVGLDYKTNSTKGEDVDEFPPGLRIQEIAPRNLTRPVALPPLLCG